MHSSLYSIIYEIAPVNYRLHNLILTLMKGVLELKSIFVRMNFTSPDWGSDRGLGNTHYKLDIEALLDC